MTQRKRMMIQTMRIQMTRTTLEMRMMTQTKAMMIQTMRIKTLKMRMMARTMMRMGTKSKLEPMLVSMMMMMSGLVLSLNSMMKMKI